MPTIALLDAQFVFKGLQKVSEPEPDSQHRINVPDDCDLKPGRYFWDHSKSRFVPVTDPLEQEKGKREVDIVKVLYRALEAIDQGKPLPPITKAWMADYKVSMDNKD